MHMRPAKSLSFSLFIALGCSSGASTPAAPRPIEPVQEPTAPAEPDESDQGFPRIQAVMLAEQFLREQGYVDTPPTRTLLRESLDAENPEEILATRQNTLLPRHVGAHFDGDTWLVIFAYRTTGTPEFGRALRVNADESMTMVHQDIRLPEPAGAVTLVGRIVHMPSNRAGCGTFHFVSTVEYEVLSVVTGEFEGSRVMVLLGCPELARSQYEEDAGNAGPLALGDEHVLRLVPNAPVVEGGHAFRGSSAHPELHRYWAEHTDRHDLGE